ncbi:MAG TPA: hypothetical protein VNA26_02935, partial [Chitinophagaceae bacterium]|nr:hypothetical protein [Chitinophagaceae bacterium]
YIFVLLISPEIIKEFGDEISIKTDCEKLLPKKDDYPQLVRLRQSIFDAIKIIPEFLAAKEKMILLNQSQAGNLKKYSSGKKFTLNSQVITHS